MPCVYSIRCNIEPYREYIGQTSQDNFQVRLNGHISDARNGRKRHLYNAIRLHGWENFTVQILHEFRREGNWREHLDELEIQEIVQRGTLAPNGYNNETGGNRNKVLHEDTKALMSAARSGERHAMFGKHHSDEARELLREANMKSVQQWTKNGELLRTFESIEEASSISGADGSHITKVCKGERKTAGGFKWKFQAANARVNEPLKFMKIQQWSFDGENLIEEFETIREASEKSGAGSGRISKCCKGASLSAGGFKWKSI